MPKFVGRGAGRVPSRPRPMRGFTLIELMIVVVIMGVLATLAIYSVNNYLQYVKVSEAREVVGSIMAAQEGFYDETSGYLDVTGGVEDDNFYPTKSKLFDGRTVVQWGGAGSCQGVPFSGVTPVTCADNFNTLGVFVNKPVVFQFASTTFAATAVPPVHSWITGFSAPAASRPGFVVIAMADLQPSGGDGVATAVVGTNMQSDLYIEDNGE